MFNQYDNLDEVEKLNEKLGDNKELKLKLHGVMQLTDVSKIHAVVGDILQEIK